MGANSAISWTDHTQNFWIGCTKVSTAATGGGACDNCYAEREFDHRHHMAEWGAGKPRHRTKTWGEPLRWNRQAEAFYGHWPRVFANSLSDIADSEVPIAWHIEAQDVIAETRNLRWMLTTKRLPNIPKLFPPEFFRDNKHVGVIASICNQDEADRDADRLRELKARLGISWVGLSIEPMLGAIDISRALSPDFTRCQNDGSPAVHEIARAAARRLGGVDFVDWIICGGESGPKARPMHPAWPRLLRDQCAAAGVAFHFKQWGEYRPSVSVEEATNYPRLVAGPDSKHPPMSGCHHMHHQVEAFLDGGEFSRSSCAVSRVGRAEAGRLLDGKEWNEFPLALRAA